MNRGHVVTAASGDLEILQGLPLSSNGIEERWADGGGGSPEENSDAVRDQRRGNEQDEESKKLRKGFLVKLDDERCINLSCLKVMVFGVLQTIVVVLSLSMLVLKSSITSIIHAKKLIFVVSTFDLFLLFLSASLIPFKQVYHTSTRTYLSIILSYRVAQLAASIRQQMLSTFCPQIAYVEIFAKFALKNP